MNKIALATLGVVAVTASAWAQTPPAKPDERRLFENLRRPEANGKFPSAEGRTMRRREVIGLGIGAAATWPFLAHAQHAPSTRRVGVHHTR
jgi:hypothetical protein